MVLKEYDNMEEVYEEVKRAACGRQACSVMLLVATEVFCNCIPFTLYSSLYSAFNFFEKYY